MPTSISLIRLSSMHPRGSMISDQTPPIGLAFIAGALKNNGFEVQCIDADALDFNRKTDIPGTPYYYTGISVEEVIEQIDSEAKIIGISQTFSKDWLHVRECIKKIREAFPEAKIVVGGEHSTAMPEYTLRDCPVIDYIVLGEGEASMLELCTLIATCDTFPCPSGICKLDGEGKFIQGSSRIRISKLDEQPLPDWETVDIRPYLDAGKSFGAGYGRNMPIMASRGCPYRCTFCSNENMWSTRYYMRSPEAVVEEIEGYVNKYQITGLQFYDLTAIVKKDWIIRFCKLLIDKDLNLEWSLPAGTRSEAIDEEVVGWLQKARLRYLVYAPESGSLETLTKIRKKIDLKKMRQSMKWAVKSGIVVRANLIIGFPFERRKNVIATLKEQLYYAFLGVEEAVTNPFQPYPGTALFQDLVDSGKIKLNDDYFRELVFIASGHVDAKDETFCEHIPKRELHLYRVAGTLLMYGIAYLTRPSRIFRTLRNLRNDQSANATEMRIKKAIKEKFKSKSNRKVA